jgi:hypothetical protein
LEIGRGLRSYFRGDLKDARRQFRLVVDENPENVSALAMLAMTSVWSGDLEAFEDSIVKLEGVQTSGTNHDRLLKAYATFLSSGEQAINELKEIVRVRPGWAFSRSLLAEASGNVALDQGDLDLAEEAVEQMRGVRWLNPDSPYVAAIATFTFHALIRLRDEEHMDGHGHQAYPDSCGSSQRPGGRGFFHVPFGPIASTLRCSPRCSFSPIFESVVMGRQNHSPHQCCLSNPLPLRLALDSLCSVRLRQRKSCPPTTFFHPA